MDTQRHTEILSKEHTFENKTFQSDIFEMNLETTKEIKFLNCVFKGETSFFNIHAQNISFTKCIFEKGLNISDCNSFTFLISDSTFLSEDVYISNTCNSISIFNNLTGKNIELSGWHKKIQFMSLKFEKLTLKDINVEYSPKETIITFKEENIITHLDFESIANFSKIDFNGGDYESIYFKGTFNNDINFNQKVSSKYLFLESSIFEGRLDIKDGKFGHINLYRSSFHGLINFNGFDVLESKATDLSIEDLTFHSSNFEKTVSVSLVALESISISNNNFEQLFDLNNHLENTKATNYTMVYISGSNQGNIIIENIYADLSLNDINLGNIYFKDIVLHTLYVNEFINKGNVAFSNLISGVFLTINKSIIGSFNLFNADLNKFKETVIADSNLEGIKLGIYPRKIRSYSSNPKIGYGIQDKSQNSQNLKSIYNQLKQIAKSSGDIDIMYKYKSLELRELIKIKRVGFDSILLILNWISNNNGRSWFRGVLFTLIIGFVCFWQYLKAMGIEIDTQNLYKEYILFISSFPELRIDKYESYNKLWNVKLVIWISRIFVSYGIYQTISAFRKYGKV
nr:hypothetical protein [uncultured Draconibacterium sp.]